MRQVGPSLGPTFDLSGAVSAVTLVAVYGAHLHMQATEETHGPTVEAAPSTFFPHGTA
jgi:hypothetical protein